MFEHLNKIVNNINNNICNTNHYLGENIKYYQKLNLLKYIKKSGKV